MHVRSSVTSTCGLGELDPYKLESARLYKLVCCFYYFITHIQKYAAVTDLIDDVSHRKIALSIAFGCSNTYIYKC